MSELIEQFKGKVVDAPGDNLLAEFGGVVNAIDCAVKMQQELAKITGLVIHLDMSKYQFF